MSELFRTSSSRRSIRVKCKISILIFDILNYIDNVYKRIFNNYFFSVLKAKVFYLVNKVVKSLNSLLRPMFNNLHICDAHINSYLTT